MVQGLSAGITLKLWKICPLNPKKGIDQHARSLNKCRDKGLGFLRYLKGLGFQTSAFHCVFTLNPKAVTWSARASLFFAASAAPKLFYSVWGL